MFRIGPLSFWSWINVNRSTFHEDVREKPLLHVFQSTTRRFKDVATTSEPTLQRRCKMSHKWKICLTFVTNVRSTFGNRRCNNVVTTSTATLYRLQLRFQKQFWLHCGLFHLELAIGLSSVSRPRQHSTVWVKKTPPSGHLTFFIFFTNGWEFLIDFYTPIIVPIYARLQVFIQLSQILTKLCHIKRDYLVHIMCSKCPPSAETHAFRRLRKSLTALLIVVCGKSL